MMMKTLIFSLLMSAQLLRAEDATDANAVWQRIVTLSQPTAGKDAEIARLNSLVETADSFWQRFADDPRVWDAKLVVLQARLDRNTLEGKKPDFAMLTSDVREIANANTAPLGTRGQAAYILIEQRANVARESRSPADLAALDADVAALIKQFPTTREAALAPLTRLEVYEAVDPTKADALLAELAKNGDPRVSLEARRRLAAKELKKKPLELKFATVDGKDFDMTKLRGKVVLVDFWATWCGPCRMEIPNVVGTYKRLHEKGFEIIGISLDSDKEKLLNYTKQMDMTWPQYFDGKVWENKISTTYGISGIPAMWLVDKKGFVRSTEARGDLEGQVSKLLAE